MILPTKHIKLSNSLLNVGAEILKHMNHSHTVTSLWHETKSLPEIKSFERFILALDFLYILGVIEFKEGLLRRIEK